MSALVASAIRNLREIRGSTSKEIMNYIRSQYTGTDTNIQKQVIDSLLKIFYQYYLFFFAQKAYCYAYYFMILLLSILIFYSSHRTDNMY